MQDELPSVNAALANGDTEKATGILEQLATRRGARRNRALAWLQLASLRLMSGSDPLESSREALMQALRLHAAVAREPLCQGVHWELRALEGARAREVRAGLRQLRQCRDGTAHYHAANAQLMIGSRTGALLHLRLALESGIPDHVRWRCHSLAGYVREQQGDFERAVTECEASVRFSSGMDRQLERLALAANLIEIREARRAVHVLAEVDDSLLPEPYDHVHKAHLRGRAEADLGNPGIALECYRRARLLLAEAGPDLAYDEIGLVLAQAQLLVDIGEFDAGIAAYREVVTLVDEGSASQYRHELAVALVDAGQQEAAQVELEAVLLDEGYAYRAEVLAELADMAFRQGDNDRAERLARRALGVRPVAPAYLCLGSIAYDYFRLNEAVSWFEQALEVSAEGDSWWVAAQQLLADVFSQMGPERADRLLQHASTALRYTDRRNDWYLPLRAHQETAQRTLAQRQRIVN